MDRRILKGKGAAEQQQPLRCPRCDSNNTKFCYYNNYSQSQPRHFCKSCRRYWTEGGTLRNVPQGGGSRKGAKRPRKTPTTTESSSSASGPAAAATTIAAAGNPEALDVVPPPQPPPMFYVGGGEGVMGLHPFIGDFGGIHPPPPTMNPGFLNFPPVDPTGLMVPPRAPVHPPQRQRRQQQVDTGGAAVFTTTTTGPAVAAAGGGGNSDGFWNVVVGDEFGINGEEGSDDQPPTSPSFI